MKKQLCIAFAVIMACVMFTVCISAAGSSASLSAEASNVNRGDTFFVAVSVSEMTEVETIGVIPSYDKSAFEFVGGEWLIGADADMPVLDMSAGVAYFGFKTTGDVNGSVLKLIFKVKNNVDFKSFTFGATVKVDGEALSTSSTSVSVVCAHSYESVVENRFLKSAASCTAKAVYYKSCSVCKEASATETFEYGDEPSHEYETGWRTDTTSHWHQCTVCGNKADLGAHVKGPDATESTPQTCTVCAYVITPAIGHTHKYSTEWSNNSDYHWYACDGCSEYKDRAAHSFDNACDTDCNVCGYVRTITHDYSKELSADAEKHWYKCNLCGAKTEEAAHIPGAEATEESAQTCTVCGYVIKAALEHTHSFGAEWKNDETNHWKECKCGEISDLTAHVWNGGVVTTEPTVDAEGVKTYACENCGAEKTEAIEKLPNESDGEKEPTESEPTESEPTGSDKKGGCGSSVSVGVGFVVIALSSALAFVFKKKED